LPTPESSDNETETLITQRETKKKMDSIFPSSSQEEFKETLTAQLEAELEKTKRIEKQLEAAKVQKQIDDTKRKREKMEQELDNLQKSNINEPAQYEKLPQLPSKFTGIYKITIINNQDFMYVAAATSNFDYPIDKYSMPEKLKQSLQNDDPVLFDLELSPNTPQPVRNVEKSRTKPTREQFRGIFSIQRTFLGQKPIKEDVFDENLVIYRGKIKFWQKEKNYGFITGSDFDKEYYFKGEHVLNAKTLRVNDAVIFQEEPGASHRAIRIKKVDRRIVETKQSEKVENHRILQPSGNSYAEILAGGYAFGNKMGYGECMKGMLDLAICYYDFDHDKVVTKFANSTLVALESTVILKILKEQDFPRVLILPKKLGKMAVDDVIAFLHGFTFCYSYLCEDSLIDEPIKYLGDLFTVSYYLDIKLLTERIEKMIRKRKLKIDVEKLKYFSERLKKIKSGDKMAESVEDLI